MALGRRERDVQEAWVATTDLPKSPGHAFYDQLNQLLAEYDFDPWVEAKCRPYYADGVGRPGIAPGVYFRMLLIGYFEGLGSQRAIAWRCADSRSLATFLGYPVTKSPPDHSSLTNTRKRLPLSAHEEVFTFVLKIARDKGFLNGKTVAVDATLLEANAAMKSIVRRDSGEDWKAYVHNLAEAEGMEAPTDEDLRRLDRKREGKKVSNEQWGSATDPASRITKMKDGRTHLAYKAEHVVDLDTNVLMAATIQPGDRGDPDSFWASLAAADTQLATVTNDAHIKEAVADKEYHSAALLADCRGCAIRTYIPERRPRGLRRWHDKPAGWRDAVYANRRRVGAVRGCAALRTCKNAT